MGEFDRDTTLAEIVGNWEAVPHEEIYRQVVTDAEGARVMDDANDAWTTFTHLLESSRAVVEHELRAAGVEWAGAAKDATTAGVTPLTDWAERAAVAGKGSHDVTGGVSSMFGETSTRMPEPVPVPSRSARVGTFPEMLAGQTDEDPVEQRASEAHRYAVDLMNNYDGYANSISGNAGEFTPPQGVTVDRADPARAPGGATVDSADYRGAGTPTGTGAPFGGPTGGSPGGTTPLAGAPTPSGPGDSGPTTSAAALTPPPTTTPSPLPSTTPPPGTGVPPSAGGPLPGLTGTLGGTGTGRGGPGGLGSGRGSYPDAPGSGGTPGTTGGPGAGARGLPGGSAIRGGIGAPGTPSAGPGSAGPGSAGTGGAGARGAGGFGPMGAGGAGNRDEDKERTAPEYLRQTNDEFWDDTPPVAPPTIGEDDD